MWGLSLHVSAACTVHIQHVFLLVRDGKVDDGPATHLTVLPLLLVVLAQSEMDLQPCTG
jgi:hypothetical protein